jgi:transcriptional regulator with XRE-family HTH domain
MPTKNNRKMQRHIRNDRLRKLREQAGLTQEEVANKLGVSENQYNKWEMGKANPRYDLLLLIVDFFKVTADFIMGRTDDPRGYPALDKLSGDEETILSAFRAGGWSGAGKLIFDRLTEQSDKGSKIPGDDTSLNTSSHRRGKRARPS